MSAPSLSDEDRARLADARGEIDTKFRRLREVVPYVMDMSAREATLSSAHGHTLDDKIALYNLARDFGFTDFALPNFFDFPSVADQFLDWVLEQDLDLTQFIVTLAVEPTDPDAPLPVRPAARRLDAGLTNLILLIEICPSTLDRSGRSTDAALDDIARYVAHYRLHFPPETDSTGRIYIRIADLYDAFDEDPGFALAVIKFLGEQPITGLMFEDVRGSRFTFETAALTRLMRHYHPPPRKILVHPHSGNGMEDAATIEAVLAGADGVWAGFTPQAAQGAHGSSMMFLTNLLRAGNAHAETLFRFEKLQHTAEAMWQIQDQTGIPVNQPVVGERAYRYVDEYFEQTDRPCDLDPARIGRTPGYQVTPAWAPTYVIGRRLAELGHGPDVTEDRDLLYTMRMLINRSQMDGRHIPFDEPDELNRLLDRARQHRASPDALSLDEQGSEVLTLRYR